MDTLRDPVWQALGVLLALASMFLAYWIYARQTRYKELSAASVSIRSLIQISDDIAHRVVVTIDSMPVDRVFLNVYAVKNSGTLPILESDYIRPMQLLFSPQARILSVHVSEERPKGIGATVKVEGNSVIVNPVMLNPLDVVELQILVASSDAAPNLDARVVDVSKLHHLIPETRHRIRKAPFTIRAFTLVYTIAIVGTLIANYPKFMDLVPNREQGYFIVLMLALVLASMVYSTFDALKGNIGRNSRRYLKDA